MSKITPQNTNRINVRTLDEPAKEKIRSLLRYGDILKISKRCEDVGYEQVSKVIRGVSNNDNVWKTTLEYLDEIETNNISGKIVRMIRGEREVA